jgi:cbb3-type cytochrome oxidase maturation protein
MSAIFFLIIIGVVVAGGFLIAFIWAVKSGQYDDDYSPSVRILFESKTTDKETPEEPEQEETNKK